MPIMVWLALRSAERCEDARVLFVSVWSAILRLVRRPQGAPMAEWEAEEGKRHGCKVVTILHHGKPRAEMCYDPSDELEVMRLFPSGNSPSRLRWVFIPFGPDKVPVGEFPHFD